MNAIKIAVLAIVLVSVGCEPQPPKEHTYLVTVLRRLDGESGTRTTGIELKATRFSSQQVADVKNLANIGGATKDVVILNVIKLDE